MARSEDSRRLVGCVLLYGVDAFERKHTSGTFGANHLRDDNASTNRMGSVEQVDRLRATDAVFIVMTYRWRRSEESLGQELADLAQL
jgi:hypothetical protein